MKSPIIPDNDDLRVESLHQLNILDTPAEDRFDRITRLVCDALGVSNSAINLIDKERQWGKSTCGVRQTESSREHSFCAHTILNESALVIADTHEDERFRDNPFVTGQPNIRFYIGYPIHAPDGHRIGSVCGFDDEPREPAENDTRIIQDIAAIVDAEFQRSKLNRSETELRDQLADAERRAKVDSLTDIWNRGAIMDILETEVNRTNRAGLTLSVIMIDIDDFKPVNDNYGHQAGDKALEIISKQLRRAIRDYDSIGRYGGEEFIAICPEVTDEEALAITERMREDVENTSIDYGEKTFNVTISAGMTVVEPGMTINPKKLVNHADEALYEAKRQGKNTVVHYSNNEEESHV